MGFTNLTRAVEAVNNSFTNGMKDTAHQSGALIAVETGRPHCVIEEFSVQFRDFGAALGRNPALLPLEVLQTVVKGYLGLGPVDQADLDAAKTAVVRAVVTYWTVNARLGALPSTTAILWIMEAPSR